MSDVILSAIAVGLGYWLCFSNTAIFFGCLLALILRFFVDMALELRRNSL